MQPIQTLPQRNKRDLARMAECHGEKSLATTPPRPSPESPWILPLAGLLGLALFSMSGMAADRGLKVGETFPDLVQFSIEGTLPDQIAGKIVVIDFWASWCGRCKESFALMEELHTRYARNGLLILAINVDESRAAMDAFLKEHPVSFHVVRDKKKSLVQAVNIPSMPTSFVLDAKGKVHSIHQGLQSPDDRARFILEIRKLLKLGRE